MPSGNHQPTEWRPRSPARRIVLSLLCFEGATVGGRGLGRLSHAIEHDPDPFEGSPVSRPQLGSDLERLESLGQLIGGVVRLAKLEMGLDVRRVELDGPLQRLDRLSPSGAPAQEHAKVQVHVGIGVVGFDGTPSFRFRLFEASREKWFHDSPTVDSSQGQGRLAVDPFQILVESSLDWQGEKLRNLIRMQLLERPAQ